MDEGGWMHTYHATVYEAPNGQRVQFRTSGAPRSYQVVVGDCFPLPLQRMHTIFAMLVPANPAFLAQL